MRNFFFLLCGMLAGALNAQIGLGTSAPASSAQIEVNSTTKGVLFPRMTNTQMLAISSPAAGLQIFNTTANSLYVYNGSQWLSELNSLKTFANAGVNVQFDNIIVQMTSSGNRSLILKTVSGNATCSGTSTNLYITATSGSNGASAFMSGYIRQSNTFTSTGFAYWQGGADFPYHGSSQEIYMVDETNGRSYRILCIVGSGYVNNFFEIERLK